MTSPADMDADAPATTVLDVAFVGHVGGDDAGTWVRAVLRRDGVDLTAA